MTRMTPATARARRRTQPTLVVTVANAANASGSYTEEFTGDDVKWHVDDYGGLHLRDADQPLAAYSPGVWVGVKRQA